MKVATSFSFTVFMVICCCKAIGQHSQRPNIVFILADDLGWDDLGFHGSRQIPTPNLDALAYDGIILGNYYVQPLCTPSRAAFLTGRYPIRYGLQQWVIISAQPYGLPLNETILPQYLKQFGYATHIVGKWHLGFVTKEYTPTHRGFDSHYGYFTGSEDYLDHTHVPTWPDDGKSWGFDFRRNEKLDPTSYGQYSTELFTSEAESIIANHDVSKPLFLYLPHQAVHSGNPVTPLEAPVKYVQKVSHITSKTRRMYAAMMSALDDSVGNVTRALYQRGMLNNTIIIFSTDNGGPADGYNRNNASNWPLRGLKSTLWEGGTRGAGFIWSPLLQHSRYTSHHLMHITDWLPTLMHIVTNNSDHFHLPKNLDGVDQWDVLSNNWKDSQRHEILYNIDPSENSSALRIGDMKLVFDSNGTTRDYDKWYPNPEGQPDEAGTMLKDQYVPHNRRMNGAGRNSLHFIPHHTRPRYSDDGRIRPTVLKEAASTEQSLLTDVLDKLGRKPLQPVEPLVVKCGPRPGNASSNCKPWIAACLFNVTADPCEYENLAASRPDVVQALQKRLQLYKQQAVPALNNLPVDDAGLPYRHNWNWVPWRKSAAQSVDEK